MYHTGQSSSIQILFSHTEDSLILKFAPFDPFLSTVNLHVQIHKIQYNKALLECVDLLFLLSNHKYYSSIHATIQNCKNNNASIVIHNKVTLDS